MTVAVTAAPSSKIQPLANVIGDVPFEAGSASAQPTKPYWATLSEDCPLDAVSFGEITFQKSIEKRVDGDRVVTIKGQLLHLNDAQVELCRTELGCRVLRLFYRRDPDTKQLYRVGQTDVSFRQWLRPGAGLNGEPFKFNGKPIEKPVEVRDPKYVPSKNDVPWTNYVALKHVTEDLLPYLQQLMGVEVTRQFLVDDALRSQGTLRDDRFGGVPVAGLPPVVGAVQTDAERLEAARQFNVAETEKEQSLAAEAGIAKGARRRPNNVMGRDDS